MDWATGLHKDGTADQTVKWCLRGLMLFPEAVESALGMPPEWWPGGFPRAMAAALIKGTPWPLEHPGIIPWAFALDVGGYPAKAADALRHLRQLSVWGAAQQVASLRARRDAVRAELKEIDKKRAKALQRCWALQEEVQEAEDRILEMEHALRAQPAAARE